MRNLCNRCQKGQDKIVFSGSLSRDVVLKEMDGDIHVHLERVKYTGQSSAFSGLILEDVAGLRVKEELLALPGADTEASYQVIV